MNRTKSQRPERQTAHVAMALDRYSIDIAALSEIRLSGYDSVENNRYIFAME